LFPATGPGSLLSGLGRQQVGERRIRFKGHLRGYRLLRRWGLGGCSSRGGAAAVPGSSWSCTVLAALVTSTTLLSKWARAGSSSDRKKTYSVDFFLAAFFTRQARRGTPVADGEAWSADGGVPATAIVTAAAAEGLASTTSDSVPGGRAGRLQGDAVSTQRYGNFATGQNSNSVPGGLDFLGLAFAHLPLALWHRR
jgi:hypothetical protein